MVGRSKRIFEAQISRTGTIFRCEEVIRVIFNVGGLMIVVTSAEQESSLRLRMVCRAASVGVVGANRQA